MPAYVVISRDFGLRTIDVFNVRAKDEKEAWAHTEQQIANTNTQEWLMTKQEAKKLKDAL